MCRKRDIMLNLETEQKCKSLGPLNPLVVQTSEAKSRLGQYFKPPSVSDKDFPKLFSLLELYRVAQGNGLITAQDAGGEPLFLTLEKLQNVCTFLRLAGRGGGGGGGWLAYFWPAWEIFRTSYLDNSVVFVRCSPFAQQQAVLLAKAVKTALKKTFNNIRVFQASKNRTEVLNFVH